MKINFSLSSKNSKLFGLKILFRFYTIFGSCEWVLLGNGTDQQSTDFLTFLQRLLF